MARLPTFGPTPCSNHDRRAVVIGVVAPEVRFFRYVEKREDGCWIWTGTTCGTKSTYGHFYPGAPAKGKVKAHRFSYELHVGPIPLGLEIDHTCRVALCVNPTHLEPVTHEENMLRARLKVCRSGRHDLTDAANVQFDPQGRRRGCIICHREKALARFYVRTGRG